MSRILCVAVIVLSACQDEPSLLGENFFQEEAFSSSFVDTVTLQVSTVIYDSLPSSNSGRLLVGKIADPWTGEIESQSLVEVGLGGGNYFLDPDVTSYDSMTLMLYHDGYSYFGLEEERQIIEVRRLEREMELRDDDRLYTTSIEVQRDSLSNTPLGFKSFKSDLEEGDEVEITLDDELGLEIFSKSINEDEDLLSSGEFKEYFKGLILTANENSLGFGGFSDSSQLRLYYTDNSTLPASNEYLSFPISGNLYYNAIYKNTNGSAFDQLTTLSESLSTNETNNESVIAGGLGLGLRIEMPYIRDLLFENEDFLISSAVLKIPIADDSYQDMTPLPGTLQVLYVDDDNEDLATIGTASLKLDEVFARDTYYEVDALGFINAQLDIRENNNNALLLRLPDTEINQSVTRAVVSDQSKGMELTIYTISTNN